MRPLVINWAPKYQICTTSTKKYINKVFKPRFIIASTKYENNCLCITSISLSRKVQNLCNKKLIKKATMKAMTAENKYHILNMSVKIYKSASWTKAEDPPEIRYLITVNLRTIRLYILGEILCIRPNHQAINRCSSKSASIFLSIYFSTVTDIQKMTEWRIPR